MCKHTLSTVLYKKLGAHSIREVPITAIASVLEPCPNTENKRRSNSTLPPNLSANFIDTLNKSNSVINHAISSTRRQRVPVFKGICTDDSLKTLVAGIAQLQGYCVRTKQPTPELRPAEHYFFFGGKRADGLVPKSLRVTDVSYRCKGASWRNPAL